MDFKGCYVPLVTPFDEKGNIDENGLRLIVNFLIEEQKVDGLVPSGTTGESPTLSHSEHIRVIEIVKDETRGRIPIIAGTGSNSTHEAINMTIQAEKLGVDASLQVCPYYNKPTQDGLMAHFKAIAKATKLPIILYNIPSRTSRNIEPETIIALSEIDNIVGVKDACGDLTQTMKILEVTGNRKKPFFVLSGEDALTFPMMCLGAHGSICAVGNVIGAEFTRMIHLSLEGKFEEAREIHYRVLPLVRALFIETNPAPIKEAMLMMKLPVGPLRLPLVPLKKSNREILERELKALGKV
jgi:4-hydroxy-tetrahydrodipicolinate synthase